MVIIVGGEEEEERADRLTDEEIYANAVKNPLTYVETIPTSRTGLIVNYVVSSLSAISSLVLIIIILRSRIRLKSIYHRIMFGMNVANACSSAAVGLATIPMPKDMIYTQFEAVSYGNTTTCAAQAAIGLIFSQATLMYFIALCIYHLLSIRYKMTEAKIRKKVEPWFHAIIVLLQIITLVLCIDAKILNPSPKEQYCTVAFYPWYCNWYEEDCQIRDVKYSMAKVAGILVYAQYFLGALIVVTSMFLIVRTVYKQEKLINLYMSKMYTSRRLGGNNLTSSDKRSGHSTTASERNLFAARSRHHFTKVVMYQAMAYVLTIITFFCIGEAMYFIRRIIFSGEAKLVPSWMMWFRIFYRSSIGEICLIVFVSGKVYDIRQVQRKLTIPQAILYMLEKREDANFILSQISIVANDPHHAGEDLSFDRGGDDDAEEEIKQEGGCMMYPFPGQSDVDDVRSTGISYAEQDEDADKNIEGGDLSIAKSLGDHSGRQLTAEDQNNADKNMEGVDLSIADSWGDHSTRTSTGPSSFGPASWFSQSTRSKAQSWMNES